MKGQAFNRANDTEIIRLISDNPGITCDALSDKFGVPVSTIQNKIKRLCDEKRVFRQRKKAPSGKGNIFLLYTMAYAKKHKIPRIYVDKAEKSTLEMQDWFNQLSRSSIVV